MVCRADNAARRDDSNLVRGIPRSRLSEDGKARPEKQDAGLDHFADPLVREPSHDRRAPADHDEEHDADKGSDDVGLTGPQKEAPEEDRGQPVDKVAGPDVGLSRPELCRDENARRRGHDRREDEQKEGSTGALSRPPRARLRSCQPCA